MVEGSWALQFLVDEGRLNIVASRSLPYQWLKDYSRTADLSPERSTRRVDSHCKRLYQRHGQAKVSLLSYGCSPEVW